MASAQILGGKTAVVTGASSGIGRAIAEKLGSAGAHVYLAGRTPDAMEASKARIEDNSGKATPVVANVRDVAQVMDLVDRAANETGRLDIMVNNAGVSRRIRRVGARCSRRTSSACSPVVRQPSEPCGGLGRKGTSLISPASPPRFPTQAYTAPRSMR